MNKYEIINETKDKINNKNIEDIINKLLATEKLNNTEFNIIIVDDTRIKELNKQYRSIDEITDVLSFAFNDTSGIIEYERDIIGEVYISFPQAMRQASELDHTIDDELRWLAVHGLYHLLGYDHIKPEDEKVMRTKEEEILL